MRKDISFVIGILVVSLILLIGLTAIAPIGTAQSTPNQESTEVTVYSNFGLIKSIKSLELEQGETQAKLENVPTQIDTRSITFKDLSSSETQVLEQNYRYDLLNDRKLDEKYLGKEITLQTKNNTHIGTLLSSTSSMILETTDGIVSVPQDQVTEIIYPKLPEGLITKPTLIWDLITTTAGQHWAEITYLTDGLSWNADYVAIVNEDDSQIDLDGWVTINNNSGADYENATLKLVAGDVRRTSSVSYPQPRAYNDYAVAESFGAPAIADGGFAESTISEYNLYSLQRPATILNNEEKQISLMSSKDVRVEKELVFEGQRYYYWRGENDNTKVRLKLKLTNSETNNLGQALPSGTIRVYKKDEFGRLQFIGDDSIEHTAKDEEIRIFIGNATDLVGERTQTSYSDCGKRCYEESYEIELRNRSDSTETIQVIENLSTGWEMLNNSDNYTTESSSKIKFTVTVGAGQTKTISYTVRYKY